jgi:hypothetical protein
MGDDPTRSGIASADLTGTGAAAAPAAQRAADPVRVLYPDDPPREAEGTQADAPEAGSRPNVDEPTEPTQAPGEPYSLTAPEGFEIAPDMLKEATPVFRDLA